MIQEGRGHPKLVAKPGSIAHLLLAPEYEGHKWQKIMVLLPLWYQRTTTARQCGLGAGLCVKVPRGYEAVLQGCEGETWAAEEITDIGDAIAVRQLPKGATGRGTSLERNARQ